MDGDSGLVFILIFGGIALALLVGALLMRKGNRQGHGADEGADTAPTGGATPGAAHHDPDPDRMAGGRASSDPH